MSQAQVEVGGGGGVYCSCDPFFNLYLYSSSSNGAPGSLIEQIGYGCECAYLSDWVGCSSNYRFFTGLADRWYSVLVSDDPL